MATSTTTGAHGKICVAGSGIVGRCWAMLFARKGYNVTLFDIKQEQLDAGISSVREQLAGLEKIGLLDGQTTEQVHARISTSSDLKEAMTGANGEVIKVSSGHHFG